MRESPVPNGSELICTRNDAVVTVVGSKKVRLGDDELSLSAATREVLELDYPVAPGEFWTFQGRLISELYEEVYERRSSRGLASWVRVRSSSRVIA